MPDWIQPNPPIAEDDLPAGERRCVQVDGKHLVVINLEGDLYVISNVCPHAGRPLQDGELSGKVITCPSHGYAYRIDTGANIDYPDVEPGVVTFPVRVSDGWIEIQTSLDTLNQATKTPAPPPFQ